LAKKTAKSPNKKRRFRSENKFRRKRRDRLSAVPGSLTDGPAMAGNYDGPDFMGLLVADLQSLPSRFVFAESYQSRAP
jgi:hypothetical protein